MLAILQKPDMLRHALPISVAAYQRMGELGLVDEKTELIRGVIFEKMSKSPLHSFLIGTIAEMLRGPVAEGFLIRVEAPLALADSCPEPDVAVVSGPLSQYRLHHPTSAKLAIEIAVSSEALNREKAAIYAEAGIEEYWIVLPDRSTIECFTQPVAGCYSSHLEVPPGASAISLTFPDFQVNLAELLTEP